MAKRSDPIEIETQLASAIRSAEDAAEISFALESIASRVDALGAARHGSLMLGALEAARTVTGDDANTASHLIRKYLVPLCLQPDVEQDAESTLRRARNRNLLRDWIETYNDGVREPLRIEVTSEIVFRLRDSAETAVARPAVWTLATIGFGGRDIANALWTISDSQSPASDDALSALAAIGIGGEARERLLAEVARRLERDGNVSGLHYAVATLRDPRLLDLIERRLVPGGRRDGLWASDLASVAAARPGDATLQDEVWRRLEQWLDREPNARHDFELGSVATKVDTPHALPWLMALAAARLRSAGSGPAGPSTYLIQHRVSDLRRPRQLDGFDLHVASDGLQACIRDATADSGMADRSQTMEGLAKRMAWQTLLSIPPAAQPGAWTPDHLWRVGGEAIAGETSGFVLGDVFDELACLRPPGLPERVAELLRRAFDVDRSGGDSLEQSVHLSAVRGATAFAASAATHESLNLLLECGLTIGGHPLRSTADAVRAVVASLVRQGAAPGPLADELLGVAEQGPAPGTRVFALAALEWLLVVSAEDVDVGHIAERLLDVVRDPALPTYGQTYAVGALVNLCDAPRVSQPHARHVIDLLRARLEIGERDHHEKAVSLNGLVRLAVGNAETEVDGYVRQFLRLAPDERGVPVIDEPRALDAHQAAFLGWLCARQPERYEPAAASLVRGGDFHAVANVLANLAGAHEHAPWPGDGAGEELAAALRQRAAAQTAFDAEPAVISWFAELFPEAFLATDWRGGAASWPREAKSRLADAVVDASQRLGGRTQHGDDVGVGHLLISLLSDGAFGVRRAAARALARLAPAHLEEVCSSWSTAAPELRRRAAEAAAWLDPDDHARLDNRHLRRLAEDPEPRVRTAAGLGTKELLRRLWSRQYREVVEAHLAEAQRSLRPQPGAGSGTGGAAGTVRELSIDVWPLYRYGLAIARTGDDADVAWLRHWLRQPLAPHVRHWLERVAKLLEENWRKATQKWPQPLFHWDGRVQDGLAGRIWATDDETRVSRVHLGLWQRVDARGKHAWGGRATATGSGLSIGLSISGSSQMRLELDSAPGKAVDVLRTGSLISSHEPSIIEFVGNGPYPEP